MDRLPRSGSHLEQIGEIFYYRRVVPPDARVAFAGKSKVKISLRTKSRIEAERLEKLHDAEFTTKLVAARQVHSPAGVAAVLIELNTDPPPRTTSEVIVRQTGALLGLEFGDVPLTGAAYEAAARVINEHFDAFRAHIDAVAALMAEFRSILPATPLAPEKWQEIHSAVIAAVKNHVMIATDADGRSLVWAFGKWQRTKNRPVQTETMVKAALDSFAEHAHVTDIAAIHRLHLTAWRDHLAETSGLKAKTINQRLQFVAAVLRTGWREAEIAATPDLSRIALPEATNAREAWPRGEIVAALAGLEPGSWAAWLFIIGLTTGTRLGELVAAQATWFNRRAGFIEVPKEATKMDKPHCVPLIKLIGEPLARYAEGRSTSYLFDCPLPSNPDLRRHKPGHEASKWFGRFFRAHGIAHTFHELRDTWIDEARHGPISRDKWEIISGHSAKTVSDGYGGERPVVIREWNEAICALSIDAEMQTAINRLVGG